MSFFEFPNTRTYDNDLGWLIKHVKQVQQTLTDFVALNTIKYADPFQWDITKQYEKNTMVVDPATGNVYLSVAPVPAGVGINRTEYWTSVYNYDAGLRNIEKNIAAGVETRQESTGAYKTGDLVWWKDTLYRVTQTISAGDPFVINGNLKALTIEEKIISVMDVITGTVENSSTASAAYGENVLLWVYDKLYVTSRTIAAGENLVEGFNITPIDVYTYISNISAALNVDIDELRETIQKTKFWIEPEDFGAVGDDIADDSAAFQAMLDALQEGDIVYLTKPKYRCDAPLLLTTNQVRITGAGASTEYWPSIITSIDSGTLLTVRAGGLGMNNVSLRRRYAATDSTTVTLLAIDADSTELQGNADTELVNCHFLFANTGVTVKGRNLLLNGVTLSSCYTGVLLENTQLDTDNRGINITNCRFHGCYLCVRNNINNARTWRNVNINSNFADISSAFFFGYGGNVNITDNLIDLFAASTKDRAIVIEADTLNPTVFQNVIANNHIIMRDQSGKGITVGVGCKCMIKDNIIENCMENGIDIMNAPVICTGNVLNNCGRGDGFFPIYVRAGSSGFLLFNILYNTSKQIFLQSGHTMTVAQNYPV